MEGSEKQPNELVDDLTTLREEVPNYLVKTIEELYNKRVLNLLKQKKVSVIDDNKKYEIPQINENKPQKENDNLHEVIAEKVLLLKILQEKQKHPVWSNRNVIDHL